MYDYCHRSQPPPNRPRPPPPTTEREDGGKGLHCIENVLRQEEQSLKSYVCRKAESDLLMTECKCLIATWKKPDEAAAWYEKPLHGAWHKGVSKVADIASTY